MITSYSLGSQMPEYRPPLTRSARKKAEMDATVVTPSGKKLNTAGNPKIQIPAWKAKGKKVIRVEEEEDEDDLDPPLDESDNINSDCDLDKHSYDAESDEEGKICRIIY